MSVPRSFPVYVSRIWWEEFSCGHQHSGQQEALNCGYNRLAQHPTAKDIRILKISLGKSGVREKIVHEISR